MSLSRPGLLFACYLLFSAPLLPQESPTTTQVGTGTPQASSVLQQSLAAMTGGTPITDITMTGTVTSSIGTNSQSGTVTMAATSAGQSRIAFNFSSGQWVTTSDYAANPRTSTTSSTAGTTNDSPEDLLGPSPAWFYPAFLMAASLQPSYVPANYDQEMHDGALAQHVTVCPQSPMPLFRSVSAGQIPLTVPPREPDVYFGQQDLYVDPSSLYPSALVFRVQGQSSQSSSGSTHPVFLPEEVRYMNYEIVQGRPVATQLQVYFGSLLVFDIQISSVTFNTGIVIAAN